MVTRDARPTTRPHSILAVGCAALTLLAGCEAAQPIAQMPYCRDYAAFFDFDSAAIKEDAEHVVCALVRDIGRRDVRISLTGHADRAGSAAYNMALSLRRARAVKEALVREGIPAERVAVHGRGETQPLILTADGVREPQNRRVELVAN